MYIFLAVRTFSLALEAGYDLHLLELQICLRPPKNVNIHIESIITICQGAILLLSIRHLKTNTYEC